MSKMVFESDIRNNLANCLEKLEPGLELIAIEFPLPNLIGTRGFIDILARDRFNNRVIIELKRSDQAARQAIHELHKYVALLRMKEGLSHGTIRTMLVSTEWSELRVPFAEFKRSTDYQCDGFELLVSEDGSILGAVKHQVASVESDIDFFSEHSVFLLEDRSRLDKVIAAIQAAFDKIGGRGAVMLVMEYFGENLGVIYRHAIYFVPTAIEGTVLKSLKLKAQEEGDLEEGSEERQVVEEYLLGRHLEELGSVWDDYEIGYPEKFSTLKALGWTISQIIRAGKVPSVGAMDDNEICRKIAGLDQSNSIAFQMSSTPRLTIQWREVKSNVRKSLVGNGQWQAASDWFFTHVESNYFDSTVSIAVYNPQNLPRTIYEFVTRQDIRFVPVFEMIAVHPDTTSVVAMVSKMCWNGAVLHDAVAVIEKNAERFMHSSHYGAQAELDQKLMHWLGLSYRFFIIRGTSNGIEQESELMLGGEGSLTDVSATKAYQGFVDFLCNNNEFVVALVNWLNAHTVR